MNLDLKKPLVVFDLETTGKNLTTDRIVELCLLKIFPSEGEKIIKTYRVNPEQPIDPGATKVHGISDEDVANEPTFAELSDEILEFIGDSDLAGFNIKNFDIPILIEEFIRVKKSFNMTGRKIIDSMTIFHKMEPRNLKAAYKFYCDKILLNAHSAEADTTATYEILLSQIERYKGVDYVDDNNNILYPITNNVDDLHQFVNDDHNVEITGRLIYDKDNNPCFNFGVHKGKKVIDVFKTTPDYITWIIVKSDFPMGVKKIISEIINKPVEG